MIRPSGLTKCALMPKTDLDTIDRRIVAELQANGRLSNVELADMVGLSPSPCSRRVVGKLLNLPIVREVRSNIAIQALKAGAPLPFGHLD